MPRSWPSERREPCAATWRLDDCSLYVTLEPCPMCAAACRQARLQLVVWGADDPQLGACGSVLDLAGDPAARTRRWHNRGGLEADRSRTLLQRFFAKQRKNRKMRSPGAERCRSGRSGRSRKPLTFHEVQGFESLPLRQFIFENSSGEVSERPKEHAWKACVGVTPPRVRIPPSPPQCTENEPGMELGPCASSSFEPCQARKGAALRGNATSAAGCLGSMAGSL
jgi:hypothetical protein